MRAVFSFGLVYAVVPMLTYRALIKVWNHHEFALGGAVLTIPVTIIAVERLFKAIDRDRKGED